MLRSLARYAHPRPPRRRYDLCSGWLAAPHEHSERWSGIGGGDGMQAVIAAFFAELGART
jgi:hypothetical protein